AASPVYVGRMDNLLRRASPLLFLSILALSRAAHPQAACPGQGGDRQKIQLDGLGRFIGSNTLTGAEAVDYDDNGWNPVQGPPTSDDPYGVPHFPNSGYPGQFNLPSSAPGDRGSRHGEGVFQVADVYLNAQYLRQHRGGYARFSFDATSAVNFGGDNVLAVQESNANCADCLPDG